MRFGVTERVLASVHTAGREVKSAMRARRYAGDRYQDPICGGSFAELLATPSGRRSAICPRCASAERHRSLWLYLTRETDLETAPLRVLHFAPEPGLQRRLRTMGNLDYTSVDLHNSHASVRADITDLPFDDATYDLVLCNHVLEHIDDDRAAVREMARVLTPAGRAVMQHPIQPGRAVTFEDPSVTDPAERDRVFFQEDHVRVYGRDFPDRLHEGGLEVLEEIRYGDRLTAQERERFAVTEHPSSRPERDFEGDTIYTCRRLTT